ncbi:sensor histidine kinase [Candidatus Enterococcus murrayae]|uniref:histidine kinase n=1 Tax=Candidatus Enterococcus murrayae TaxID=2815321 RepID=A0ABS3HG41_9ENTE|nr:HAMP domain-containing sensor histidine kinase [Enterococcus sp. MJM16]MBO0452406.1 HAMP domain-containing histidine kinase [Enterococcus sp. MJM16]
MRYLYQQLLAFWLLIILTLVLINVSFTNINKRTLADQNYNEMMKYIKSVNATLNGFHTDLSDSFSEPYGNLSREEILPYYLFNAEQVLANQQIKFVFIDSQKNIIYPKNNKELQKSLLDDWEWEQLKQGGNISKTIKYDLDGKPNQTSYVLSNRSVSNEFNGVLIASKSASEKLISDNLLKGFIISSLFGGAISFGLAARQVKKINDLKRAVNQIANGNYEIEIEEKDNKDEFNELAHDFNKMAVALQENEKEIIRQEELRKQFMANTSHEMRTPLTTIKGLLEGFEYGAIPESQKEKAVSLMQNETDRLIRLVKQNLDFENIRSQQITLSATTFNGTEAIKNIIAQLGKKAESMNDQIVLLNEETVAIYADHDRFIQIMVNIIQNAIQFTKNGEIKIVLKETDSDVLISVEDNGIGMTEEEQKNIWDRYFKADPSRKNTKLGESGLGLSIVKELVRLHRGSIDVFSEKDQGTTFTVRFPKEG